MSIQACSPLALPTLDMYLLLSKFESIHGVFIDATLQTNLYYNTLVVMARVGPLPSLSCRYFRLGSLSLLHDNAATYSC